MGILDFGSFFELMMIECLLPDFILFDIYFYLKLEMMENKHLHFPDQARLADNKNFFDEITRDLQSSPSSGENQRLNVTLTLVVGTREQSSLQSNLHNSNTAKGILN